MRRIAAVFLAIALCAVAPFQARAMKQVIDELKLAKEKAKLTAPGDPNSATDLSEKLAAAETIIAEGTAAIAQMEEDIARVDKEKMELQQEKNRLEQIQTALTSGLIGAIVTAIVAIAGVILKTLGSRVDKDIKRLEVVEKMTELMRKDVAIPADILRVYGTGSPATPSPE